MKIGKIRQRGFTLIEILIVIGIIAILAAVVIVAINPAKQFATANDSQRSSNVNTILNAIGQYMIGENKGIVPTVITSSYVEICQTGAASCTNLVDLSFLTASEKYLVSIPIDPRCPGDCATNGTGYKVKKSANGRVTVDAPLAQTASISVTR